MKLEFKRQEKNKKRFSVFTNGEYLFSMSEYTFSSEGLYDGIEIEDIEEFKGKCMKKEYFNYCLNILSKNSYTKKALCDKLILKGCDKDVCEEIIKRLSDIGLISDESYKESFIFSAQNYKKQGHKKIKQELYLKGIHADDEDFDMELERENLKALVKKMIELKTDTKKIISRLLNKGYNFSDIKEAIENFKECEFNYEEY